MRYTEIDTTKSNSYRLKSSAVSESLEIMNGAYNKLGQLEDIEEELGIDLLTLFKALKNGIYEKFEDGEYVKFNGLCMPIKSHKLKLNVNKKCLERGNDYFYFKDYGKTWALTKEELE